MSTSANLPAARTLLKMLTARRPAGSRSERRFIREYIIPLGVTQDKAGNLYRRIGDAPVMWSCHTDTVHRMGGIQRIAYGDGLVMLHNKSISNCLGADDTTGVWLMCEMLRAERPGLYVFHRGEEIGGVGSSYIANMAPQITDGIGCAIALDRMGKGDVITHQGARCCSNDFALALSAKLGMSFTPSDGGVFTDTANYVDIVGECTNLSVGYGKQHTALEYQDIPFALSLRDILLDLDTRDLPIVRKPGELDPCDDYSVYSGAYGSMDDDVYAQSRMCDLVADFPEEVADILREYGLAADDLHAELYNRGAMVGMRRPR